VHAWGDFVHNEARGRHEEFHAQHAHVVQRVQDARGDEDGVGLERCCDRCGYGGGGEDAVGMDVLARVVGGDRPVAGARGDDADLPREVDEALGDGGGAVQRGERCLGVGADTRA
jgi:hypothetical protein